MQLGKGRNAFKWVWSIPVAYAAIAGIEALLAGSIVGLMYVLFLAFVWYVNGLADNGEDWARFMMLGTFACRRGYPSYGL
jgi:hypothetical protein